MALRFYDITCTLGSKSGVSKESTYKGEMGEQLDLEGNIKTVLTAVLKMLIIDLQYKTAMANMF